LADQTCKMHGLHQVILLPDAPYNIWKIGDLGDFDRLEYWNFEYSRGDLLLVSSRPDVIFTGICLEPVNHNDFICIIINLVLMRTEYFHYTSETYNGNGNRTTQTSKSQRKI